MAAPQTTKRMIEKIVSGGQTGVDRAALDSAIALQIPHGGWCPAGRKAENGIIPAHYHLLETASPEYIDRTRKNVEDSDGTLILNRKRPEGGTAETLGFARSCGKPVMVIDLDFPPDADTVLSWLKDNNIRQCNMAGPRESKMPGIYQQACRYLQDLLTY